MAKLSTVDDDRKKEMGFFFILFVCLQVMNVVGFYVSLHLFYLWLFLWVSFVWCASNTCGFFCWTSIKNGVGVEDKYQELLN